MYSQLRTTADKREIKDFPKLPSATSFIRKSYMTFRPFGVSENIKIQG